MNVCLECSRIYEKNRKSGHRGSICNSCQVKKKRKQMKQRAVEYKGGSCKICGYNKCFRALEFHHLDPSKKEIKISDNTLRSWEVVKAELDKCVLLCACCHVEVHDGITIIQGSPNW